MLFQEGGQNYKLLKFIVIGVNMPEDMYVFDTLFVRFCNSFCFASHFFINKNAELIARHLLINPF